MHAALRTLPASCAASWRLDVPRAATFTLYRVQAKLPVRLREKAEQAALGRDSFDLQLVDGLVQPSRGETFTGPNGASLRPVGPAMHRILTSFRGTPTVYSLLGGTQVPEGLVLLHEHTDHFSLQPAEPMTLDELNARITRLLEQSPKQTREQWLAAAEDEDNQDN